MLRAIGLILRTIWAICTLAAGAFAGAAIGFTCIGWAGGIVLGLIGLGAGALAAIYPWETIARVVEGLLDVL